jgi:hypothetical protein
MEKPRSNKSAKIASSSEHVGHTITKDAAGEESDLSGQLRHVNITIKHANGPEKTIKAVRDGHDAGMAAAIPVLHPGDCE